MLQSRYGTPVQAYEVGLRRTRPENADALIDDAVTTTTTVEVFRTTVIRAEMFAVQFLRKPN